MGQFAIIERRKAVHARGTGGKNKTFCHSYTGEFCHLPPPSAAVRHRPPLYATKRANYRRGICHSQGADYSFSLDRNVLDCPRLDRTRRSQAQTVATEISHTPLGGEIHRPLRRAATFSGADIADGIGYRTARTGARARGRPEGRESVAFGFFDFLSISPLRRERGFGIIFAFEDTRKWNPCRELQSWNHNTIRAPFMGLCIHAQVPPHEGRALSCQNGKWNLHGSE